MKTGLPALIEEPGEIMPGTGPVIRCMIVDDEQHSIDLLARHVAHTPSLQLSYATTKVTEILERAEKEPFDLLFLDVEMPLLNGFELLGMLEGKCHFILCSGHQEYALKGFDHEVCDYLLKPITYARFIKAVEKVKQQIKLRQQSNVIKNTGPEKEYILLKGDRKHRHILVYLDEIDYVKSIAHYMTIVVKGEKKTIHASTKQMLQHLPAEKFIRVHNSYIVPLNRISYVDFDNVGLYNVTMPIPVSDSYREPLLQVLRERQRKA